MKWSALVLWGIWAEREGKKEMMLNVSIAVRERWRLNAAKCNIMRFLFSSIHCSIAIIEFVHFIYVFVFVLFFFSGFSVLFSEAMNLWVGIFHSRLSFMWIVLWYCLLPIHLPLININSTAPHSHAHTAHSPVYAYEKVWKGEDRIRLKSYTGKCANHKRKCTCMCSEAKRAKETWCLTWILNVCCVKCSLFVCTKPHNYVLWKRSIEYRRYIARILYEGALCV